MTPAEGDVLEFGDYRFDRGNQLLSRAGEELPLPPRALGVLSRLLDEPGSVVSKQTLLDSVWNGAYVTETSLSEAVGLLREALQDAPQAPAYIQTVHRRGYRFIAPVRVVSVAPAPAPEAAAATPRVFPRALAVTAVTLLLFAAVALVAFTRPRRPQAPRPLIARFGVAPPPAHELVATVPSLAVSPDGRHLVYTARRGDETVLFHRDVSAFTSREIPGTRGALAPFFSADGRRVGFFLDAQLVAVPLAGGAVLPLTPVSGYYWGAGWSEDDSLVFAAGLPASLFRVRRGEAVKRLTQAEPQQGTSHVWPRMLPGGKAIVFTVWKTSFWDARVEWLSLVTGERRTLLTGTADCSPAKGLLVCARAGGTIIAAPLDAERGRLTGPPLPLLRDVAMLPLTGFAQLAVGGGTLIYLAGTQDTPPRVLQRLVSGTPVPLAAPSLPYDNFREGPHGKVAVTMLDRGRSHIWVLHAANGTLSRLTFERFNTDPVWSPDGQWVAYASRDQGAFNLYRRRADGTGGAEQLLHGSLDQYPVAWSPDGRELMLLQTNPTTGFDLWLYDVATRKARPWHRTPAKELSAAWSPDGKWVAYTTGETSRWEIYVSSYPSGQGRWQVSAEGGQNPSWSTDGRRIYFQRRPHVGRGAELWSVPVDPKGDELRPGEATRVFTQPTMRLGTSGPGGVLLLSDREPPAKPTEVRVMLDWPSAL